jgi:2-polyprenylphenol 6-hydroxylase
VKRPCIVVVGAGPVGLSFAAAAREAEICILDAGPVPAQSDSAQFDIRVFALSPGTRDFLRELGAWERMPRERIAPVARMEIFGDEGASRLEFAAPAGGALAWIVEGNRLLRALGQVLDARGIAVRNDARIASIEARADGAEVCLEDGTALTGDLVVGADGADSRVRELLGLSVAEKRYRETAVVAHFRCERAPAGVARQWFRRDGILAWLPLPGDRISIVWSTMHAHAEQLVQMPPDEFAQRVRDAGGAALGELALDSPVARFPLRLIRVPNTVLPGAALIGDAAHGIHPLAGQGVNLGFQDARALAATLSGRSPLERPGDLALLRRHERARREDVGAMQFVTDRLEWLFGLDAPGAVAIRNSGLRLVNALPGVRNRLAARAMR